jgi:fructokinase
VVDAGLRTAEAFKLNDEELPVVAGLLGISGSENDVLRSLLEKYDLKLIALTRGEKGSVLAARDEWSEQLAAPTKVVDTIGAGDAFTAVLAMGMLRGAPLDAINRHACRLAAYVCSQPGATPPVPNELTEFE